MSNSNCYVCGYSTDSLFKLSYHIRDNHKEYNSKKYYDQFLKKEYDGKCKQCNSQTTFVSLVNGYQKLCKNKVCTGKYHRAQLVNDKEKHQCFVEKVSFNMKNIWKLRENTGLKDIIVNKTTHKNIQNIMQMNDQQRKERFSRYYKCDSETIKKVNQQGRNQCMKNFRTGVAGWQSGWKGVFKPNHPEKYNGNPKNIIYRSQLELKYMIHLDSDPSIIKWASEEMFVPYTSPKDRKLHRYFPDFVIEKKNKDGKIETIMIEIKPDIQTKQPSKTAGKSKKSFFNEALTYAINQAKWESAERYCKSNGYIFQILTEKQLRVF